MRAHRTIPLTRATVLLAAAVAMGLPGAAYAQTEESLTVDPSTVQAGGQLQVSGQCPAGGDGEDVPVLATQGFEGGLLGRVPIGADGSFSGTVTINANAPSGSGQVSVSCPDGTTVLNADLTVEGSEPQPIGEVPGPSTPAGGVDAGLGGGAGMDPAVMGLGAAGALFAAAGATLLARRRTA